MVPKAEHGLLLNHSASIFKRRANMFPFLSCFALKTIRRGHKVGKGHIGVPGGVGKGFEGI